MGSCTGTSLFVNCLYECLRRRSQNMDVVFMRPAYANIVDVIRWDCRKMDGKRESEDQW